MMWPRFTVTRDVNVQIWSDIVCPWCYIGKRRIETALTEFEHAEEVDVVWRSFQLDPSAPPKREGDMVEHLARKYGISRDEAIANRQRLTDLAAAEGLDFQLDRTTAGNTFDAHRVLHLAAERGVQDAVKERFMRAYFTEGRAIGDPAVLAELAGEAGLDPAEVAEVLRSSAHGDAVLADQQQAARIGISGVPFFVVDDRYGVSGAQPVDVLLQVLRRAWDDEHPLEMVPADAGVTCEGDACGV
jgi:predicted DsbA family dithiol-disulfide isomerase